MATNKLAKKLWQHFNLEAKKIGFCATEYKALSYIPNNKINKTLLSIGESMIGYWNSLSANGALTLGPRSLMTTYAEGRIIEGKSRVWISPAPVGSDITIVIRKIEGKAPHPGRAAATVLAEKFDDKGNSMERLIIRFTKGKYEERKTITFSNTSIGFIIITVDTKLVPGKSFVYKIKYQENVIKSDTRKVKGFADLHTHPAAEDAFGGKWLHGKMMGAPNVVLTACNRKNHLLSDVLQNGLSPSLKIIKDKYDIKTPLNEAAGIHHGNGFPTFEDWPHHNDFAHQQIHENWLKQAFEGGLKLIIGCAVNSEILSILLKAPINGEEWRDMPAMEKQLRKMKAFAEKHSDWAEIAYNPWHARKIIHSNKLAIVLSVESSNIFPLDKGSYKKQINELYCLGVRCVQIVHQCDNRYAGAAPQARPLVGIQELGRVTRLSMHKHRAKLEKNGLEAYFEDDPDKPLGFQLDDEGLNTRGLTNAGKGLIKELMNRRMLIDVAHYSSKSFDDTYELAKSNKYYPLICTHTKFPDILSAKQLKIQREFLTTKRQLEKINETGGIVGLRTAHWSDSKSCCGTNNPLVETDTQGDPGTVKNFAQQLMYANDNSAEIAFGTDLNGFINQLAPRGQKATEQKPNTVSQEYWDKGLCHIGMLPDVVKDLKYLGAKGIDKLENSAESFLKSWERTWDENREKVDKNNIQDLIDLSALSNKTTIKIAVDVAKKKKASSIKRPKSKGKK